MERERVSVWSHRQTDVSSIVASLSISPTCLVKRFYVRIREVKGGRSKVNVKAPI